VSDSECEIVRGMYVCLWSFTISVNVIFLWKATLKIRFYLNMLPLKIKVSKLIVCW